MLARLRKAKENGESGFTLIELLVVMIIIGILAAIAIPAFLNQKKKGYEASEKSDLRSIATEITTQLVDDPAAVTISQAGGAGTPVTVGDGLINASPGNTITGTVDPSTGAYCVSAANPKAGKTFYISNTGGLSDVAC